MGLVSSLALLSVLATEGGEAGSKRVATPKIAITVRLNSNEGRVYCALHSRPDAFPSDAKKAVATRRVEPKKKKAICVFEAPPRGTYAVAAYHDSNGNGELDTNWLGIPSEGTAATHDAKGSMGPPKFEDASFRFGEKDFAQTITMSY